MKKTLAYAATAVLIGTALMLFPLVFLSPSAFNETSDKQATPTSETHDKTPSPSIAPQSLPEETPTRSVPEPNDASAQEPETGESTSAFLSNLPYAGLILATGFVVALCVSKYSRIK